MKLFYVNLFFNDTKQPFDLTNVTGISAAFPPTTPGSPVLVTLASSNLAIVGAPGAGLISILVTAVNSALIQLNPNGNQLQDLQVEVTVGSGGNASSPQGTVGFLLPGVLNVILPSYGVIVP